MTRYKVVLALAFLFAFCASGSLAQVSPYAGVGAVQFLDNNGKPLTSGVLYSYQAGTLIQQATFTDATGSFQNPNPIPFVAGGRTSIWLTNSAIYKFVLCAQDDGSACASGDILFTVDNVPGNPVGGSSGNTFTGTFISASSGAATSGILRLAATDQICWRNASNSANLCWSLDSNNLLSWAGGSFKEPLVPAPPACVAGFDIIWADSGTGVWNVCNGTAGAFQLVTDSADINSGNQVVSTHLALPLPAAQGGTGLNLTGSTGTGPDVQTGAAGNTIAPAGQKACFDGSGNITSSGCAPAIQVYNNCPMAGDVTVSSTALTTVVTCAVTMPAFGCPCRIQYNWSATVTMTNNTHASFWVFDGTNNFRASPVFGQTSDTTGSSGSGMTSVTYANNAAVTLTLETQGAGSPSYTVSATPLVGSGAHSGMDVSVFSSN